MAYVIIEGEIGVQKIADTSTTQNHDLGKIVRAVDPTYGEGEFVYLKGVASTAVGSCALYDQKAGTTALADAGDRGSVGFAMSANVANQYGWYQISGSAVSDAGTVAAEGVAYLTATDGELDDAVVSGDKIDGAVFKTADGTPSAGLAVLQIARPSANGNG